MITSNRAAIVVTALAASAALVVIVGGGCPARGEPEPQISYDIVPRASWTYDALGWLAKRGLMRAYSARDFLISRTYTRVEVADIIRDLKAVNGHSWNDFTPTELQVLSQLVDEYRNDLRFLGVNLEGFQEGLDPEAGRGAIWNAWAYGEALREGSETTSMGTGSLAVVSMQGRSAVAGAAVTNERRLFHRDNHRPFPIIDRFYYRQRDREWTWEAGRTYAWFGSAGTGSMLLGDDSPPLLLGRAGKEFSLGRFGHWRMSWLVGGYSEGGENFYLISKRAQKTLSRQWSLAITDVAKTTETPNPLMLALPGPVYQSMFLEDVDSKWNAMLGLEVIYHPTRRLDVYGQWMVDDLNNPLDPGEDVPKKTGLLFGIRSRSGEPMDAGTRFQIEYATIDRRAYEATRADAPMLAWTQDGLPLGWAYGGNSETLSVRAERKIGKSIDLVTTLIDSQAKTGEGDWKVWSLQPTWDITRSSSVGVVYESHSGDVDQDVFGLKATAVW